LTLNCDLMRSALKGRVVSVPYPGVSTALNAVMAGHVDFAFVPQSGLGPVLESQKVRVLASAGSRTPGKPFEKLPLLKDTWPVSWMTVFTGLFFPVGTPQGVVERLNQDVNAVLAGTEMQDYAARTGNNLVGGGSDVLARTLERSIEVFRRVAAEVALRPASAPSAR
jgi:tripartite-type tricarboxylate transporter receptor subunit TctC